MLFVKQKTLNIDDIKGLSLDCYVIATGFELIWQAELYLALYNQI